MKGKKEVALGEGPPLCAPCGVVFRPGLVAAQCIMGSILGLFHAPLTGLRTWKMIQTPGQFGPPGYAGELLLKQRLNLRARYPIAPLLSEAFYMPCPLGFVSQGAI